MLFPHMYAEPSRGSDASPSRVRIETPSIINPDLQECGAEYLGNGRLPGPEEEVDDELVHDEVLRENAGAVQMGEDVLDEVEDVVGRVVATVLGEPHVGIPGVAAFRRWVHKGRVEQRGSERGTSVFYAGTEAGEGGDACGRTSRGVQVFAMAHGRGVLGDGGRRDIVNAVCVS